MTPIICCGESDQTRSEGHTEEFVTSQIQSALADVSQQDMKNVVIAYEPIWAIGSGHTPTPEDADAVCGAIRRLIARLYGDDVAEAIRILYGGSMNTGNVSLFMPESNIDGGLIGGASLDAESFTALVKACLAQGA